MDKKVLLFGGTFNPLHIGHLIISRDVAERLNISKVVLIPNGNPAHKEKTIDKNIKLKMIQDFVKTDSFFDVCDFEINNPEKSYTYNTVKWYKKEYGLKTENIYWLLGRDSLCGIHKWHKIEKLIKECVFVVAPRDLNDDFQLYKKDKPIIRSASIINCNGENSSILFKGINISSSNIRGKVKEGKSIKYLVPEAIEKNIEDFQLYK